MFDSSPRPNKRQRLNHENDTSPRTPRSLARKSAGRSVLTYGTRRKASSAINGASDALATGGAADNGGNVRQNGTFTESTHHSMSPTQDELNHASEQAQTPSRRGRKRRKELPEESDDTPHMNGADLGKTKTMEGREVEIINGESIDGQSAPAEDKDGEDSGLEGDTIVVRTSSRARKKTWKSAAADEDVREVRSVSAKITSHINIDQSTPIKETKVKRPLARAATKEIVDSLQADPGDDLEQVTATTPSKKKRGRPPKEAARLGDSQGVDPSLEIISKPVQARRGAEKQFSTPQKKAGSTPGSLKKTKEKDTGAVQLDVGATGDAKKVDLIRLLRSQLNRTFLDATKEEVLGCLTNRRPNPPIVGEDHERAYQKVYQVLDRTIGAGEGNSMLLIGARGTAKTTVVETALRQLAGQYRGDFHVVRLNGFFQTDDKLALREIWRQLGKEMNVEDGSMDDRGNYADTLASLLALLSQPEELSTAAEKREKTSKSVIFILNEFDLFTSHPRQTLLYNLFDIAQSRKAPIAVLGLTTRIDIVENLEKRVKSRFSHRYVHLAHPKTFTAFLNICKAFLLALPPDPEAASQISTPTAPPSPLAALLTTHGPRFSTFHTAWSAYISSLLSSPALNTYLKRTYHQTKSASSFLNSALLPIASLSPTNLPTPASFLANTLRPPDSKLSLLPSLSELELALLISAARLDIVLDTDTCNFNMAYDEYVSLAQRARVQASASGSIALGGSHGGGRVWGREVAMGAWESLEEVGLLMAVGGGHADMGKGARLVRADVSLEEIRDSHGLEGLKGAMGRWCKEI
ncbi:hypothetical protein MMC10_008052 [Thelotrema lepadinum]|nr:hypothetical protein [Thelotrema lepadinum]